MSWRQTPHPSELVSTCGAALSHKGRGHNNAHCALLRPVFMAAYVSANAIGRATNPATHPAPACAPGACTAQSSLR
ncbi:hypothetical protein C2U70_11690 [Bradyrhizobium guangdongense]|nr:hypothetical protein C2U70_11690 [Bradyrhizobium guangdongense]